MIPLEEAQAYVLSGCPALDPVTVSLDAAHGLVAAESITSPEAVPPFDNTAMDGFAVRSVDTAAAPCTLEVAGTLAAGMAPSVEVGPGQAIRIMTGAPMPPGADAVIMVELTTLAADGGTVEIAESVPAGNHVRRAGDDLTTGQMVFEAGEVLSAGHLGVLASIGRYEIAAHRRVRVGVASTGDELIDGPEPLAAGQIRDSNRHTLLALVAAEGCEAVDLGLIKDEEGPLTDALTAAAADCDAIITSGGVSMGAFDYVKVVLDKIADMRWMQVAIKPAKPLAFGRIRSTPCFGLPGNPVSSMVSFELFARAGLRQMMGHTEIHRPRLRAIADADMRRRTDGKTHFARVVARIDAEGRYRVAFAGGQGSHQLNAMARANALAVVPDGEGIAADDPVSIILFR
ncbi:MAG: molybdopterin molybdotransferase MoeA [Acidimicrobiales bacterium]|nr:molybdopterin molybdotransferase MoeA [Acidimicrobiales bacterium]